MKKELLQVRVERGRMRVPHPSGQIRVGLEIFFLFAFELSKIR
jgi:hypothetical protein